MSHSRGHFNLLFAISLLSASVAAADTLSTSMSLESGMLNEELLFEEIPSVYAASKYEQKLTEAPASVTIITAEEIRKFGYRELPDILRSVRGFFTTYDRNYHYVAARGIGIPGDYNTRVLLMVDGHRINENVLDYAQIGTEFPLDVDLIDRVEIIRGPSSSLYGTSAFLGVINVITRRGRDFQGAEVSTEAGSFDTRKLRLSYGKRLNNGLELLLSASGMDSDGQQSLYYAEFDDPATNNGYAENADDDQYSRFFASLSYGDFRLQAAYVDREKGIPTASYDTEFNDARTRTNDAHSYLDLLYRHDFGATGVTARLFYDRFEYDGHYIYDYADYVADPLAQPDLVDSQDYQHGEWWGAELQLSRKIGSHRLTLGNEYRKNIKIAQGAFDPFDTYLDDRRSNAIWAVYLQDEFALSEQLTVNLGVRHDRYQTIGNTTNPRLALIYSPAEKTTLKLLYGEAFRAPNAYELYYQDGGFTQKPALMLEPETIQTTELVLEQYLGKRLRAVASVFQNKIEDLISLKTDTADGLLIFRNVGRIDTHGVELELEGKWPNGWNARASYTYQDAKDRDTGQHQVNSPHNLAKFHLIAPLGSERLFAGLELLYTGERESVQGQSIGGFTVTNLTLYGHKVTKGLDLSASVYNLFDKQYADTGGEEHIQNSIAQDGRAFRLKLDYRF